MKKIISIFCILFSFSAKAQVADYDFGKESGQITEIEGYTGIVITNHIVNDDEVLPAKIAIPFPFRFNGTVYDSVGISENGFIWFGTESAQNMADVINPITAAYSPNVKGVISALGTDMHPHMNTGLTTTIKSGSIGTAGFHELIIEWKNTSRFDAVPDALGEDTILFQIKLYEFLNRVEIAYGSFGLNPNISSDIEVGLRGSTATDFNIRKTGTGHKWTNSTKGLLNTDVCVLNADTMPNYGDLFVWMNLNQPTGLNKAAKNNAVKVYPNPTTGKLFFEAENMENNTVVITNIAGQQVLKATGTTAIDMGSNPVGIYFYTVVNAADSVVATGKFALTK